MHFFVLLLYIVIANDLSLILSNQNSELQSMNEKLHKQLSNISKNFSVQIQEDYFYNKQRIISLIFEYNREPDDLVKIFLAEELLEYIRGIIEDANLLGGEIEGVPAKSLLKLMQELKQTTRKSKEVYFAKESAAFYNELHNVLMKKKDLVQELQSENAKLYGKIESKHAEIKEINRNMENDLKKYEETLQELNTLKSNYNSQISELESTLQYSKRQKLGNLIEEDNRILDLQQENTLKSVEIEKFTAEISILNSKLKSLTETLNRLQKDLDAKSVQLSSSQKKFEEFSAAIQTETIFEVSSITKSEEQLQTERNDLDEKARSLQSELNKCETDSETLKSILKAKGIMIEENCKGLKETENRQAVALEQRQKEIDNLVIKVQKVQGKIQEFKTNLDETLKKISEKSIVIQEIQDQLRGIKHDDSKSQNYYRPDKII